jgi:hypothetical protein
MTAGRILIPVWVFFDWFVENQTILIPKWVSSSKLFIGADESFDRVICSLTGDGVLDSPSKNSNDWRSNNITCNVIPRQASRGQLSLWAGLGKHKLIRLLYSRGMQEPKVGRFRQYLLRSLFWLVKNIISSEVAGGRYRPKECVSELSKQTGLRRAKND